MWTITSGFAEQSSWCRGPDDHGVGDMEWEYFRAALIWPQGSKSPSAAGVHQGSSLTQFIYCEPSFSTLRPIHDMTPHKCGQSEELIKKMYSQHKLKCKWHPNLLGNMDVSCLHWKLLFFFFKKNIVSYIEVYKCLPIDTVIPRERVLAFQQSTNRFWGLLV